MELYPIKFQPIYKYRLWGWNKLKKVLKKDCKGNNIGESWEVSDIGGEIHSVDDQKDFDFPSFDYGGGNSYGYIFQSPNQSQLMNDYLIECFKALNVIYMDLGMDLINLQWYFLINWIDVSKFLCHKRFYCIIRPVSY